MAGAHLPGLAKEYVCLGNQDDGTFATAYAGAPSPTWKSRDCCDGFTDATDSARVVYTVCCSGGNSVLYVRNPGMTGGGVINTYPPGSLPGFQAISIFDHLSTNGYVVVTTSGVFTTGDIGAN